jgi:hypothetical protein
MNAMGHSVRTYIGVNLKSTAKRIQRIGVELDGPHLADRDVRGDLEPLALGRDPAAVGARDPTTWGTGRSTATSRTTP